MKIRTATPEDFGNLAALLVRNNYGPNSELDAEGLQAVFKERVVRHCVVGIDEDGKVCGCIAVAQGSGRRSLPFSAAFSGMFVVDRKYRNSTLAGRLFQAAFEEVIREGVIHRLHLEVDPSNMEAFPLYLRAGFRSLPGARADDDGYVEMISQIPGLVNHLLREQGKMSANLSQKPNLRMIRGGRNASASEGVTVREDRIIFTQRITTSDSEFIASLDYFTGELLEIENVAGLAVEFKSSVKPERTNESIQILVNEALGDGHFRVDSDGTTTVTVEGQTILRELWPVRQGIEAPGVRRRSHIVVEGVHNGDESISLLGSDGIQRTIRIFDESVSITTRCPDGRVVCSPWVTMRKALYGQLKDGEWVIAPLLLGLWPEAWTDFEAAYPLATAKSATVTDGRYTLTSTWKGLATLEGRSFPTLRSRFDGEPVELKLALRSGATKDGESPLGIHSLAPGHRRGKDSAEMALSSSFSAVSLAKKGRLTTMSVEDGQVTLAEERGIISWTDSQGLIASGPYPATSTLGSITKRRMALWAAALNDRRDLDQGVEWAEDTDGLPLTSEQISLGSSRLRVEVGAESPDVGIMFSPLTGSSPEFSVRVAGSVWRVDPGSSWRASVEAATVSLKDGRTLVMACSGRRPELFIRILKEGVLVTALGAGKVVLDLEVFESQALAERILVGERQDACRDCVPLPRRGDHD